MPAHESSISMDTRVIYNKGGKRNGYLPDTFDRPPDWDNEYSEEDEVFVESPTMDMSSATRPLMYPRARTKTKIARGTRCRCRPIVHALCCFLFLVLSLGSLMGLVVYYVNKHDKHKLLSPQIETIVSKTSFIKQKPEVDFSNIVGCDKVQVEDVWVAGIPKLLTESAFRLVDVNNDGVLDVLLGFATGADGYSIPKIVCDIYFEGTYPCFGGMIALEGATGKELWRHYAGHEMYSISCEVDFNKDGITDCLASGRAGTFQAISGKDGSLIWNFGKQEAKNDIMNLYTAQIIHDLDGDGTVDILTIHGGDPLQEPGSTYRLSGRILLMSGRTGKVIRWMGVPDNKESYYSPQVYTQVDGTQLVLFGTGGETHGGSLWVIKLDDLVRGDIDRAWAIYTDKYKGVMTPPVLADITEDGVVDIIIPTFNSSVLAIDGDTFKVLWNYTFPMSESYNTPSPGFYNNDNIPDFLVKYANGPGFPVYYHSATTVLDGKTGKPLIDPPIRDTVGAQASGITISMEGRGNDIFLYWIADCANHDGEGGKFQFVEGTNVHEQSRSDFCRLRFKTKGYSKIYAIGQHIKAPGTAIYYSEERIEAEHDKWINTTKVGIDFVKSHPEYLAEYQKFGSYDDVTGDRRTEQTDKKSRLHLKEGGESLYETPLLDSSERTSYKKGPTMDVLKKTFRNRPNSKGISDFDYHQSYYTDPLEGYSNSALPRDRGRSQIDDGNSKFRGSYNKFHRQTTPVYDYPRDRYRERYPHNIRKDRVKERTSSSANAYNIDNKLNNNPLAMRDKRGRTIKRRSLVNRKQTDDDYKTLNRKRKRRHVGPHDEEGLQRLLSTGSLAPSTLPKNHPMYNQSVEFVFATYWFFPAKTRAILPEDQKCIEKKLSEETIRFDPKSKYFGQDHDSYEHTVTDECIHKGNHDLPDHGTYESQTRYNPFNVHMGQMTVYRVRITCTCSNTSILIDGNKRCGNILPFDQQQWTSYMGNNADSHWKPSHL